MFRKGLISYLTMLLSLCLAGQNADAHCTVSCAEGTSTDNSELGIGKIDTIEQTVLTGTRMKAVRSSIPNHISSVSREDLSWADSPSMVSSLSGNVPGLFVTERGVGGYGVSNGSAGNISMRGFGSSAGRILILIDGHPQFESLYGHPVADEYMSEQAGHVEVIHGASSVLYGSNAMGGAINIITREPAGEGNSFCAKLSGGSFGTLRGSLSGNFRKGKFSGTLTAGHEHTDGHRQNSGFNSNGGMLKAGYRFSDRWKAGASLDLNRSYSENPGMVAAPLLDNHADVTRGMADMSLDNDYGKFCGSAILYYNWGNHLIDDGHTADEPFQPFMFHGKDYQGGATVFESFRTGSGNVITGGMDARIYGGTAYRNPETELYADHRMISEAAAYILDKYTLSRLSATAGIRIECNSVYGHEVIPHIGLTWNPAGNTAVKFSTSKGFRTPNMKELYMFATANADLIPEEAWNYDMTASRRFFGGHLYMEMCLFLTQGSNIIEVTVEDGRRANRNVGSFCNKGMEFSASADITENLSASLNYSFLRMTTIMTGSPEQMAYASLKWHRGRFKAGAGAMFVKDLHLTSGPGSRTSSYCNLKARTSFTIGKGLELFVRGENLLGQEYETMDGFPMPGTTAYGGLSISLQRP